MGKRVPMWQVLICIVFALGVICYSIFFTTSKYTSPEYDGYSEAHMPMILAAVVVSIFGALNGWKWSVMEKGMIQGISRSMQANLILLTVGILVSTWKAAGIIPSIIYYGLNIISPGFFLVTACLLCSIISLVIGSSYTTAGTIGVAMVGIAIGLGINPALAAGAVVAGAYTGDKMSPMSDTTNMAPAVSGSNVFEHIRHMVYTVTPSYIIALVLYFILGRSAAPDGAVQMEMKDTLQNAIQEEFTVSPFLMLPIVFLLIAVILKVPALPAMFGGVVMECVNNIDIPDDGILQLHEFMLELTANDVYKLESLENMIISLEDNLLMDKSPSGDGIRDIIKVRKDLLKVKRYYEQMEFLTDEIAAIDPAFGFIDKKFDRLLEFVLHLQEYIEQVREAYQSQIDIEQNNIMKVFTVVTSIFLPLTLIAGWYGMNLRMPEFKWAWGYPFVIGMSLAVIAALVIIFKKKKWF